MTRDNPHELIAQSFGNYYYGLEQSPVGKKIVDYFRKELRWCIEINRYFHMQMVATA